MATKILLVEDFTLIRSGVRALLESAKKVEIVGEAVNGREAVKLAKQLNPDIVLMDVAMPEMTGIEATRQIREAVPGALVIMLSMHGDRQYIFESLRAGASGYVLKNAALDELLTAIDTVLAGRTYLATELADMVRNEYLRWVRGEQIDTELGKLTGREREVLQLIAEGNSSAEIAQRLHISVRTVDTHRFHIMEKLEIHSIAGLTKFAIRNGLGSL